MPFLSPNQQHQSTEGKNVKMEVVEIKKRNDKIKQQ